MPPVAVVYHNKFVPVAVSGTAVCPWQYVIGVDETVGAGEVGNTVIVFVILSLPQVWVTLEAVSFTV